MLAGNAIRSKATSWVDYLNYYRRSRRDLARKAISYRRPVGKHDPQERRHCVYANFEPLLAEMEYSTEQVGTDAFQLMQFFAFCHHRNIRRDILIKAVKNPRIEAGDRPAEDDQQPTIAAVQPSRDWRDTVRQGVTRFVEAMMSSSIYSWLFIQQTTIPALLGKDALLDDEVNPDRLNKAFIHLQKSSFISPGEEPDTYTVHPLIHEWMRIRLDSPGREAVWCDAAASALANCIVLDANALSPERVSMRTSRHFISRELLPHIRHLRQCQQHLYESYEKVQSRSRSRLLPRFMLSHSSLTPLEAVRLAKFSIVYFQCGEWQIARELQEQVRNFILQMRGTDHPNSHRITAALAATYYHLDRFEDAVEMMREIVASSIRMYGEDQPRTLKSVDSLAQFLCHSGKLTESRQLHKKAWQGFSSLESHGPNHKDSLLALRHLGAVEARFFRYEKSAALCEQALEGLRHCSDVEDEIVFTKEDIALAIAHRKHDPDRARTLMVEVLERRKIIWGDEHPYTLFAELNFSRVDCEIGNYQAAEDRLQRILPIGIRSVGETHNAVQLAENYLARSWVGQKRFVEAEAMYKKVLDDYDEVGRHKGPKDHIQRILTLWSLVACYDEWSKFAEAKEVAEDLLDSVEKIGDDKYGLNHPLYAQVVDKLSELQRKLGRGTENNG